MPSLAASRAWKVANADRVRQHEAEYYAANKERIRLRRQRYYQRRKEELRAYSVAYRAANLESAKAATARYKKQNPERIRVINNRRRAWQREGADLTVAQWKTILAEFNGHCAYCGETGSPLAQEHMVPLSRGGKHTASNVVPACRSCNSQKGTQTAREFAGWDSPPSRSV